MPTPSEANWLSVICFDLATDLSPQMIFLSIGGGHFLSSAQINQLKGCLNPANMPVKGVFSRWPFNMAGRKKVVAHLFKLNHHPLMLHFNILSL